MNINDNFLLLFLVTVFPLTKQHDLEATRLSELKESAENIVLNVVEKLKGKGIKVPDIDWEDYYTKTYICATGVEIKGFENYKLDKTVSEDIRFYLKFDELYLEYGLIKELRSQFWRPFPLENEKMCHPLHQTTVKITFAWVQTPSVGLYCYFSVSCGLIESCFSPKMQVDNPEFYHIKFIGAKNPWGSWFKGYIQDIMSTGYLSKVLSYIVIGDYHQLIANSFLIELNSLFIEANKGGVWNYPKTTLSLLQLPEKSPRFKKYCNGNGDQ